MLFLTLRAHFVRLSARKLASDRTPDRSVRSWFYTATMIPSSSPNPTNATDVGEMETTLIRPTFVWTPNDTTDVTFIWENG